MGATLAITRVNRGGASGTPTVGSVGVPSGLPAAAKRTRGTAPETAGSAAARRQGYRAARKERRRSHPACALKRAARRSPVCRRLAGEQRARLKEAVRQAKSPASKGQGTRCAPQARSISSAASGSFLARLCARPPKPSVCGCPTRGALFEESARYGREASVRTATAGNGRPCGRAANG